MTAVPDGRLGYAPQLFVEQALPRVRSDLAALVGLHAAFLTRDANDGAVYYFMTGFEGWCAADPSRPSAVIDAIRAGAAPETMLRAALVTGLNSDRARFLATVQKMVADGTPAEQLIATQVLGGFTGFADTELASVVADLEAALARTTGDATLPPLRALLAIALRATVNAEIGVRALTTVAPRSDAAVREAIANELMFRTAHATPALMAAALDLLGKTEASETATLNAIDHIIAHHLAGQLAPMTHAFLDDLLARRVATMKRLSSTASTLLTGDAAIRAETEARWLAAESAGQFMAVRDLCNGFGEDAPRFDLDFTGLPRATSERIARRCCALLMVFPETIASIFASLLRTGPAAAFPVIERLLFDPLLLNYWSGPRIYLAPQAAAAPPPMAAVLGRVFKRHDEYKAGVEAVRGLPELRPSQHHRFLVETKRRDQQRAIGKAAQRRSIVADIFPTSLLLYGDSAIFDMHVEPGKTVRQEAPMQTHEFSHELPRVEVIDPFGAWYQREHLLRGEVDE